ncbi:hypothetical protein BHM03_00038432, partial [Ensete ventricosum]
LSYGTDDQSLRETLTNFGEVVEARVIMDRETGWSRGFGFVTFTSNEEASAAISGMDEKRSLLQLYQDLHGRMVRVNYAAERTGGFRDGSYGGGGSGGSDNGGGSYSGSSDYGGGYSSGGGYGGGRYGDGGSCNTGPAGGAGGYDGTGGGYDNGGNYGIANGGGGGRYCGSKGGVVTGGGSNADYGSGVYGGSESTGFGSRFSKNGGYPNLYEH